MLILDQIKPFFSKTEQSFPENMIREYLQYLILDAIFSSKYGSKMKFIGGTCIRIIYNGQRFSEDLDFDNHGLTLGEFKALAQLVKAVLEREGFKVELKIVSKTAFRCIVKLPGLLYSYKLTSNEKSKLSIFINTTKSNLKSPTKTVIINKFGIYREIRTQPLNIILSQKILAFLERPRTKGRDIYDIVYLWPKTEPNFKYLKSNNKSLTNLSKLLKAMKTKLKSENLRDLAVDVKAFLPGKRQVQEVIMFDRWLEQLIKNQTTS